MVLPSRFGGVPVGVQRLKKIARPKAINDAGTGERRNNSLAVACLETSTLAQ